MNNIKKFFLLNALILASIGAIAQKIIIFNPSPDFYILQPGIQNTAAYDNEKLFSSLNYKNRLGVISEIRDLYFDICLPINLNQRTGIKLYSEQETSLFTKNKAEVFYSYKVNFENDITWILAAQGGIANINFGASGASVGGSAFSSDFSISTLISFGNLKIGAAAKQLPNAILKPINYEFTLARYWEMYFMYSYLLDKNWKTDVSINTSIYNEFFIWNVNTAIEYQQQLGIIGRLGQKMNYAIGAYTLLQDVLSYNMKFALSYSNAYYPGIPNSNTLSALLAITK